METVINRKYKFNMKIDLVKAWARIKYRLFGFLNKYFISVNVLEKTQNTLPENQKHWLESEMITNL